MNATDTERSARAWLLAAGRCSPWRRAAAGAAAIRRRRERRSARSASSVTSSDGKVTVGVGDNALQAPVGDLDRAGHARCGHGGRPELRRPAPPTPTPRRTIQVPDQVLITIESPAAVGAAAAPPGRKFALALPPGYMPPPTCLVNPVRTAA